MSELPKGWATTTLDDLCLFNPRHDLSIDRSTEVSFIPMPSVSDTLGTIEEHEIRQLGEVRQGYTHFQDGDVIFAKITPCMENGKIAVAEGLHNGLACGSTEFHVLRTQGAIAPRLLWYFLRQKNFRDDAERHMTGAVGQRRVPAQYMKDVKFLLPPLAEQRRIVAKLDSLFARTRRARAELARIPPLVEHYKQAILAAAFRGDLTKDWRLHTHPLPTTGDTSGIDGRTGDLPPLPDSWSWTSIDAISQVAGGLTKNALRRQLSERVPYLRVANVYANELRLDDVQKIGCTAAELKRTKLERGDLLVVEGNGSLEQIGRVALWDGSINPCSHQNHLIRVRASSSVTPQFLLYWMLSPLGRQYIERVASSSSGLHTLSISKVSGLPIPLCSRQEMQEIVTTIEKAWNWIDRLLEEHSKATKLLGRLDESLLRKAFRGELVPQDPNDEPASTLLERIRTERAEQSQEKVRSRQLSLSI